MKASGVNLEEFVKMPINDLDTWSFTWSFFVETFKQAGPIATLLTISGAQKVSRVIKLTSQLRKIRNEIVDYQNANPEKFEKYNENLRTKGRIISGSVNKKAGKVFVSKPAEMKTAVSNYKFSNSRQKQVQQQNQPEQELGGEVNVIKR